MYRKISTERWNEAQAAERKYHNFSYDEGRKHYHKSYATYFSLLGMHFDLKGSSVTEIGPADFPALAYCTNYATSVVIEPMPSTWLMKSIDNKPIVLIKEAVENIYPDELPETKEVWIFNVMQHIIDPDEFIDQCKTIGEIVRFFEPINYPTSVHHPHAFDIDDFKNWFPDENCVQLYKGGSVAGFHQADCAYGTFIV